MRRRLFAEGRYVARPSANPLWGHVAEDEDGDLLLPAWWRKRRAHPDCPGGWWDRPLRLWNPLHWAPILRSSLRGVAWVEVDQ